LERIPSDDALNAVIREGTDTVEFEELNFDNLDEESKKMVTVPLNEAKLVKEPRAPRTVNSAVPVLFLLFVFILLFKTMFVLLHL
jgi:hypothetical protein